MRYLPYMEEKSWDDQILTPVEQIAMNPRIEGLPLYSAAYNMMVGNDKRTEDLPAFARYFIGVPSAFGGMLVDGVGQIGNTALNGYKRAYNNGAAMYNNVAAQIENWLTPTVTPQTSLTGRRIGIDMAPVLPQTPAVTKVAVPQPDTYIMNDGQIVAKEIKPPVYQYSTSMPSDKRVESREAKSLIANTLKAMKKSGQLEAQPAVAKSLINLYKKLK